MGGVPNAIRTGLLLAGLPVGLAGLGGVLAWIGQDGVFGLSGLAAAYLLMSVILVFMLIGPYVVLFRRVRRAARTPNGATNGESIAITGDLVAAGTVRTPVEQTPVALTAWRTNCSYLSNAGVGTATTDGDERSDVQGYGIYSAIGRIRTQRESRALEVDIPSTLTSTNGRLALPTPGTLFSYIAYQLRLTPVMTVDDLMVIIPGRIARRATASSETATSDTSADCSVAAEQSQYPTGKPPRKVQAFVGEHRETALASSPSSGASTPRLEYTFGVSAPEGSQHHEQTAADGGAQDTSDSLDCSAATTSSDETAEKSRFSVDLDVKNLLPGWYTDARENSANRTTHTVRAWGLRKRATVTVLGTYRTGGYTDERMTLSENYVDLIVAGEYDDLYQWVRRGLLGAVYATACFGVLGIIFLMWSITETSPEALGLFRL